MLEGDDRRRAMAAARATATRRPPPPLTTPPGLRPRLVKGGWGGYGHGAHRPAPRRPAAIRAGAGAVLRHTGPAAWGTGDDGEVLGPPSPAGARHGNPKIAFFWGGGVGMGARRRSGGGGSKNGLPCRGLCFVEERVLAPKAPEHKFWPGKVFFTKNPPPSPTSA